MKADDIRLPVLNVHIMNRTRIILASLFFLTLASGLVAGLLLAKLPEKKVTMIQRSALAEALALDDQQETRVKAIWEAIGSNVDDCYIQVTRIQAKHDELVFDLLTDEQKLKYNKIQKETALALANLKKDRDGMFVDAVEKTKFLLNEDQKKKYARILEARLGSSSAKDWIGSPVTQPVN